MKTFKELFKSKHHTYIGMKDYDDINGANMLNKRIKDELKTDVYCVEYIKLPNGSWYYAYFIGDVEKSVIDRAVEIVKLWNGEHDPFYDDVLGEQANPEMIQAVSIGLGNTKEE